MQNEIPKDLQQIIASSRKGKTIEFDDYIAIRALEKLEEHGENLTKYAKNGKLDDVIGREKELDALMLTLGRRKKGNPVLIGPAGVGKTQIVNGLAHKISRKEAGFLNGFTIIELSTTGLVAGCSYVGMVEKKMKEVLELASCISNLILFIDEIHTIVGSGKGKDGNNDIANILKPALANGSIKLIGATTDGEFKILTADPALERRFNKIDVPELTTDETIAVMKGIKHVYEKYHGVKYSTKVLEVIPVVAKRYRPKRMNPDSSVDLMDYAGARAKIAGRDKVLLKDLKETVQSLTDEKEIDVTPLKDSEVNTGVIGFKFNNKK